MCVNDLVVQGAEPLFFLDYFACGQLDPTVATAVIDGIAAGCELAGCALIGGETAEMPGMYAATDYDLAGFAVGAAERDALLDEGLAAEGDLILGLESNGIHSNGFSLVRRVIERSGTKLSEPAPFQPGNSLADCLLAPTRIYVRGCLAALRTGGVRALAHITGGGLPENLPRVLGPGLAAEIVPGSWPVPPVFDWIAAQGRIDEPEMRRTFNCGIGMAVVVAPDAADAVQAAFAQEGETVHRIGRVAAQGSGPLLRMLDRT